MANPHLNYTIWPMESFILTLSKYNDHRNILSAYPQKTRNLSVRGNIINNALEFVFLPRNTKKSCVLKKIELHS